MVYETNCTEITQDKWRELMKYGRKCSYRLLTARIKRELPELYHALALQFYNVSIRPRACFFPLFSFLPLWLHYNLNPLCVQY